MAIAFTLGHVLNATIGPHFRLRLKSTAIAPLVQDTQISPLD